MEVLITLYLAIMMPLAAKVALMVRGKDLGFLPTVLMIALDMALLMMLWLFFMTIKQSMIDYKPFIAGGFMLGTITRVIYVVRVTLT